MENANQTQLKPFNNINIIYPPTESLLGMDRFHFFEKRSLFYKNEEEKTKNVKNVLKKRTYSNKCRFIKTVIFKNNLSFFLFLTFVFKNDGFSVLKKRLFLKTIAFRFSNDRS